MSVQKSVVIEENYEHSYECNGVSGYRSNGEGNMENGE